MILAGGKGERFWPLSRQNRPKQFLSLDGSGQSLLQATAQRLLPLAQGWEHLWVVTSAAIAPGVQAQLPQLPAANLLVEPQGQDTAPAIAWTVLEVVRDQGEDAVIGFFPADHWIEDEAQFQTVLQAAAALARTETAIVTLGIQPGYPATGYGYIKHGEGIGSFQGIPAYRVDRFTEKPDRQQATQFLADGCFSWNGGIFVMRAGVALGELRRYAPEILSLLEAEGPAAYGRLPKISIDYALMEKTQHAYVMPAAFGWDDLGDWNAIARLSGQDGTNAELAHHVGLDTQGSILYASDPEDLIVTIGLEDTVVVREGKVTLIVRRDRTQDIKGVLKTLQSDPKFDGLL